MALKTSTKEGSATGFDVRGLAVLAGTLGSLDSLYVDTSSNYDDLSSLRVSRRIDDAFSSLCVRGTDRGSWGDAPADPFFDFPGSRAVTSDSSDVNRLLKSHESVLLVGSADHLTASDVPIEQRRRLASDPDSVRLVRALNDWGGWLSPLQITAFSGVDAHSMARERVDDLCDAGLVVRVELRVNGRGRPRLAAYGLGKATFLSRFVKDAKAAGLWPVLEPHSLRSAPENNLVTNVMAAELVLRLVCDQSAVSAVVPPRYALVSNLFGIDYGSTTSLDAGVVFGEPPTIDADGKGSLGPKSRLLVIEFDRSQRQPSVLRTKMAKALSPKFKDRRNVAALWVTRSTSDRRKLSVAYGDALEHVLDSSSGRGVRLEALGHEVKFGLRGPARTSGIIDIQDWFPERSMATELWDDGVIIGVDGNNRCTSLESILSKSDPVSWPIDGVRLVGRDDFAYRSGADLVVRPLRVSPSMRPEAFIVPADFEDAKVFFKWLRESNQLDVFRFDKLVWPDADWVLEAEKQVRAGLMAIEIPDNEVEAKRLLDRLLSLHSPDVADGLLVWPNAAWCARAKVWWSDQVTAIRWS